VKTNAIRFIATPSSDGRPSASTMKGVAEAALRLR